MDERKEEQLELDLDLHVELDLHEDLFEKTVGMIRDRDAGRLEPIPHDVDMYMMEETAPPVPAIGDEGVIYSNGFKYHVVIEDIKKAPVEAGYLIKVKSVGKTEAPPFFTEDWISLGWLDGWRMSQRIEKFRVLMMDSNELPEVVE